MKMIFANLIVVVLGASCVSAFHLPASSDFHLPCASPASTLTVNAMKEMWTYPENCVNSTTTINLQQATTMNAMTLLFTDFMFTNSTPVAEGGMLTVTVKEMMGKTAMPPATAKYQNIIICSSTDMSMMNMMPCIERASRMNMAQMVIETMLPVGETQGFGLTFNTMVMAREDVLGYVDCRCMGSDPMTDGNTATPMMTVPAGGHNYSTMANPCMGTQCMAILMTDAASTFTVDMIDVASLQSDSNVEATLYGKMVDPNNQNMVVDTLQIMVTNNKTAVMNDMLYSSMLMLNLDVSYMSYMEYNSTAGLLPQSMSTIGITVVDQLMGNVTNKGVTKLTKETGSGSSMTIMAPSMYDFADVVYTWEIDVSLANKDSAKYTLGLTAGACTGLSANNSVVVRQSSSNGDIKKTFDSCKTKSMELATANDLGIRKVFVEYTRMNARLATGGWSITLSTFKSSATTSVASLVTLLVAVTVALLR